MRAGCKGHRDYEWALVATTSPRHWLLIRCKISDPADLAFFYCHAPALVSLSILIKVAGKPWPTEENFQAAKGLTGLDEHQVRTWASWHRWTTLAMIACAFLTITAAAEHARHPAPPGQISLTRNEIASLLTALILQPARDACHHLRWSTWRRRHQHRARNCHYQRQARPL